ncbi:jg15338 [Pararge aegeria aegeria]|uniref:Jg15338 protein n=1 Tax=Pararge aegeria aegeria TaxID=348720 RepID=A0A8S4RKQ5_9NEOP|nr:jg15338 [Pararge aegeria aegeria]
MSFEKCYYRRCCFCLPLRGGLLALGYIHVIFSTLMVGLISYSVHTDSRDTFVIEGVISGIDREVCIAGYCIEFIFTVLLLYGVHRYCRYTLHSR